MNMKNSRAERDEIAIPKKIDRPLSPYVIKKMRQKSFMNEKTQVAIRQIIEKVNNNEKE